MVFLIFFLIISNLLAKMPTDSKIFVAGHHGLVGSSICKVLRENGYNNLILKNHNELDLENESLVDEFFKDNKPDYVFLSAAKVGGILANNNYPVDFLTKNLRIELNVISSSFKYGVKKLLFLGSSCIYPRLCSQPIKEEYLLSSFLEPTNEWYAIAKIAGIKICQAYNKQYNTNFISCMPTNLYGPEDNFSLLDSHVIPGLMLRIHKAKINNESEVVIWGTGSPRREFLYIDDLAEALFVLMNEYNSNEIINIGCGYDISIKDLATLISKIVGFKGKLVFDNSKPDGTPQKLLDTSKINSLGWQSKTNLENGLFVTYEWLINNYENIKI